MGGKVELRASRAALLPALNLGKSAVAKRSTIPILANMLLEVADGRLRVVGTDLDAELSTSIEVTHAGSGAFTVPAATLHDAVRKLPDGADVTITADQANAVIASGRSRFTIPTLPADDYPRLEARDLPHAFALASTTLKTMLDTVGFAVSSEETRYYLNGILLEGDQGALLGVATDGHRLARYAAADVDTGDMPKIIVPRQTLPLLASLCEEKGDVQVSLSETKIRFEIAGRVLVSKLVDGTYPDYRRVIPSGNANAFNVDRTDLVAALERVTTMGPAKGTAVRATFDSEGTLRLFAKNPDLGEASDEIACDCLDGETVEVGFSGRYALDMLGAAACDTITFRLADAGAPMLVKPTAGDGADTALFVLMPMRI